MPQMNPETAELLKEKIESLLTEFINQGDIKYSVSIAKNKVIVTIVEKRHRTPNRPLIVDFGNGEVIQTTRKKTAAQVLVDVINKADPAIVQQQNIKTSGNLNLVSDTLPSENDKAYKPLIGGKYAITKTSTAEKEFQIRRIIETLKPDWTVQW